MSIIKRLFKKLSQRYWTIGFVINGLDGVMNDNPIRVEWLKMPKYGWFADPFVLEVYDDEIHILVEEKPIGQDKGVITLLKIDRHDFSIKSKKNILDLPTHLSFPCILRKNGKIYIYPESAKSEKLNIYEYSTETETVSFYKTICDDVIWDSCIIDLFDERMLFTSAHNDTTLDVYRWDEVKERFMPWKQVISDNKNMRMGGQLFEYKGEVYYPAQDCNSGYGSAIQIKKVIYENHDFSFDIIKRITSPHPKMKLGLHTLNVYKDIVVIDVYGHRYPFAGKTLDWIAKILYRS